MEWVAFWLFCAVLAICCNVPKIVRARAEAKCAHKWDQLRSGPVVENMGQPDERRIGSYTLFRCEICGAERDYR